MIDWLEVHRGDTPLIVCLPHTGADIPAAIEARLVSPWLSRKDTDWWVDRLYAFAADLGATVIRTQMSRTVIDVNRDPSGRSLYPGQVTTGLCPLESFDGEPFYIAGQEPGDAEIGTRRATWFDPYHSAVSTEIERLRAASGRVVLYDAHSIRSRVPRLFEGTLHDLNIGTNDGRSCDPSLAATLAQLSKASSFTSIVDGRFKGGWTTRHYGRPETGVHAIQMELACSTYLDEPDAFSAENWPAPFLTDRAAPLQALLQTLLVAAIDFAIKGATS